MINKGAFIEDSKNRRVYEKLKQARNSTPSSDEQRYEKKPGIKHILLLRVVFLQIALQR
jgi:hypothetical protein